MKRIRAIITSMAVVSMLCLFSLGWAQAQDHKASPEQLIAQKKANKQRPPKTQRSNQGQRTAQIAELMGDEDFLAPELLGHPTDRSVTVNVIPKQEFEVFCEYGTQPGLYTGKTDVVLAPAQMPLEMLLDGLQPNTRYYYRLRYRQPGDTEFRARDELTFHTQRAPGSTFTFAIQGDSHPERAHQHDPALYTRTLRNVAADQPDFYLTIGDDFSIDTLKTVTNEAIEGIYLNQRRFFGLVGNSAPIFLVNGNHEQGAAYLLDGTPDNPAVWVQNTRNRYYPQPAPDEFYTGDMQPVEHIGLLRDYYAWTWGDALFVVIDPYWHSPVPVDNRLEGGNKRNNIWSITLGETQYLWFKQTLEQSTAKYKFVFAHHVLGTGRGGIEMANLYEWGGENKKGVWEFDQQRPGWELPIHQLMAKFGITIFFHGHDHLFVQQELDGVIYQELPEPADLNYMAYNENAYKSGIKLPNSGHVRVTVSASEVQVDYVRAWLPQDETSGHKNGEIAYTYTIKAQP